MNNMSNNSSGGGGGGGAKYPQQQQINNNNNQNNNNNNNDQFKIKRGFKLTHQKLVLDIDVDNKSIQGYTEILIQPQTRKLKVDKIRINSRQCFVTKVTVNQVETQFQLKNYMETIVSNPDIRDMDTYTAYSKAALHYSDEGELLIDIPSSVQFYEGVSIAESNNNLQHRNIVQFSPLIIRIYYRLINPVASLQFILPDEENYPFRKSHMYTYSQPDGARMWFPCVDQISEKCTWELDLTANSNLVVVATGQLLEKVCNEDETKNTFIYRQDIPTPASGIGLCVGPFEIYPDPFVSNVTHFCLPHKLSELKHSVHFFHQIYSFFEEYLGTLFPYTSYKQVFVEDVPQNSTSYSTLSILNSHLLHGPSIIDQTFITRKLIATSLSNQWFGQYLSAKTWSDQWLFFGLSGYMSSQFIKKHFGLNEYRYNLVKEEEYVGSVDNGTQPPLYNEHFIHPIDLYSELAIRKSPLVIYMIEKRITEDGLRKVLNNLLNTPISSLLSNANNLKLTDSPPMIDLNNNNNNNSNSNNSNNQNGNSMLSPDQQQQNGNGQQQQQLNISSSQNIDTMIQTKKFLKLIKSMTGQDLKLFAEKWIYGKGTPNLICGFNFNRKKFQTEFALKQVCNRPDDKIASTLTIRITELEGTYEQVINFDDDMFEYDFPCHSRCRKTKKKKLLSEDGEEMEIDLSQKRETPLLWFRIDPDLEWIHKITFRQPEYMWIHQLELDRDVIAQMEAVGGLKDYFTQNAVRAVFKFLSNPRYFYKVRTDAALLLSKISTKETNFEGMDLLINYFKQHFYDPDSNRVKTNNFKDFNAYFMQKVIPLSISLIKDREGRTPYECILFIIQLLKDNDNNLNPYSDNFYLESLLLSVGNIHTNNQRHLKKLQKQVTRYLEYDQFYPSYRNTITIGALKALCEIYLQSSKYTPVDFDIFLKHIKYSNFEEVRKVSFQCLYKLSNYLQRNPNSPPSLNNGNGNSIGNSIVITNGNGNIHNNSNGGNLNNDKVIYPTPTSATTCSIIEFFLDIFDNEKSLMIKHFIIQMISLPPSNMEDKQYISLVKDDLRLIDRLWGYLNSKTTTFDFHLRYRIQKFYRYVWGKNTPSAFTRKLKSSSVIKLKTGALSSSHHSKKESSSSSNHRHHSSNRNNNNNNNNNNSSIGSMNNNNINNSNSNGSTTSTLKKRKSEDTPISTSTDQPLKIHIRLPGSGGVISSNTTTTDSSNSNITISTSHNSLSSSSSSSNQPIAPVVSNKGVDSTTTVTTTSSITNSTTIPSSSSSTTTIKDDPMVVEDSTKDLKKYLDENDMNDPDFKALLEISKERKHHRDHHREHRSDRDHHREHRSDRDHHRSSSTSKHKHESSSSTSSSNNVSNESSPFKDTTSSSSSTTTTTTITKDNINSNSNETTANEILDLDMDDKSHLELIADIKRREKKSHHRDHKDHKEHRDHHRDHKEHNSSSSTTHNEHGSSSSNTSSSHRSKEHSSHRSSDREHRSSDREHRSSGDREHKSGDREHRSSDREHRSSDREHRSSDREHRSSGDRERTSSEHRSSSHHRRSDHNSRHSDREHRESSHSNRDVDKIERKPITYSSDTPGENIEVDIVGSTLESPISTTIKEEVPSSSSAPSKLIIPIKIKTNVDKSSSSSEQPQPQQRKLIIKTSKGENTTTTSTNTTPTPTPTTTTQSNDSSSIKVIKKSPIVFKSSSSIPTTSITDTNSPTNTSSEQTTTPPPLQISENNNDEQKPKKIIKFNFGKSNITKTL